MLSECVNCYTAEQLYNFIYMARKNPFDKCSTVIVREKFIQKCKAMNSFQLLKLIVCKPTRFQEVNYEFLLASQSF